MIERPREGDHTGDGNQTVRALEAHDTAIRGGPEHRADRLRAERQRHHARRDGRGRARRRAAGRVAVVPRVSGRRRIAISELRGHGLAERDRTGRADARDRRGVRDRTRMGEGPGATGGWHPGDVENVLHADRDAVQRPAQLPGTHLRFALTRDGEGSGGVDVRPRAQVSVERADPRQARFDQLDRAQDPLTDRLRRLPDAERGRLSGSHRAPPRPPRSGRTRASGRRLRNEPARRGRALAPSRSRRGGRHRRPREAAGEPPLES